MTLSAKTAAFRRAHEATTQGLWQTNPFKALIDCEQIDEDGMPTPLLAMAWPTTYRSERETYANADFIALAHSEWPALLDRIEALEAENARLREGLETAWSEAHKMRNASKLVGPYPNDRAATRTWARSLYHAGKGLCEKLKPYLGDPT